MLLAPALRIETADYIVCDEDWFRTNPHRRCRARLPFSEDLERVPMTGRWFVAATDGEQLNVTVVKRQGDRRIITMFRADFVDPYWVDDDDYLEHRFNKAS